MEKQGKFKQWQFPKMRLEAFSDAVFAIVMTLLVLDLKLPHIVHPSDMQEIKAALISVAPLAFGWAVSFFFVALIWVHHHNILNMSTKSDYAVIWINIIMLFFISLLPFPTALMAEYPGQPVFVMFWGLTFSAGTFSLTWFYYYNVKHYLKDSYDQKQVMKNVRLSILAGPTIYLVAAFLAWVSIYISFALYALTPFLYILPLDKEVRREE